MSGEVRKQGQIYLNCSNTPKKTLHASLETVLLIIPLGGLMQWVTRSLHAVPISSTACKIIGNREL